MVKSYPVFLLLVLFSTSARAQHPVPLRNLWMRPQVHVVFNEYTLSFTIRDIDKSLGFLASIGDTTYGMQCGLDTGKNYVYELYPGTHTEYKFPMQPLLQNGVGCFLLTAGHAVVQNKKHKALREIIVDIDPLEPGDTIAMISFYDPKTKKMVFQGKMATRLYKKDLGIDD